jgi:signal transduction histidine kinase
LQQLWAVNWQRMAGQQVPLLRGNLDGRSNRGVGPGVRGGADVVEGMMIHFCTSADYDVTLEKLAELLRPLLAQGAPEEVDLRQQVHGLTQRLAAVETERDEANAANAELYRTMTEATKARDEAQRECDKLADYNTDLSRLLHDAQSRLAAVETERDELAETLARRERQNTTLLRAIEGMADSRDRLAAQVTEGVQAIERLTAERDEARRVATQHAEKLEAIPWEGLGRWVSYYALPDSAESLWFYTNRPTAQAQD